MGAGVNSIWLAPLSHTHPPAPTNAFGMEAVTDIEPQSKPLILYSLHCEGQPHVGGGWEGHLEGKGQILKERFTRP